MKNSNQNDRAFFKNARSAQEQSSLLKKNQVSYTIQNYSKLPTRDSLETSWRKTQLASHLISSILRFSTPRLGFFFR